jgi:hypothetical protein
MACGPRPQGNSRIFVGTFVPFYVSHAAFEFTPPFGKFSMITGMKKQRKP